MTAFRLELRRNRTLTIWLGVLMAAYGAIMALMYPIMVDNDALMTQYMETFPQEFLAAFGMTGSLSDPGVFYTTYISSWLWPIMAAVVALLLGTRVAADLDRGFLDLPLATPMSRVEVSRLVQSPARQSRWPSWPRSRSAGVWVIARLINVDFDAGRFALAGVLSWLFGCAIAGATTLLAVVTLSRGPSVGDRRLASWSPCTSSSSSMQISADWAWIAPVSAWDHFRTTELIDDGIAAGWRPGDVRARRRWQAGSGRWWRSGDATWRPEGEAQPSRLRPRGPPRSRRGSPRRTSRAWPGPCP